MSDPRHLLGAEAEAATATWLAACGWTLLARRYRAPGGGEIDLVLLDPDGTLVGLEVRARRSPRAGTPGETVDGRRMRRIGRSLAAFAIGSAVRHTGLRVDLVAAEPLPGPPAGRLRLRLIRGAGS